MARQRPDLDTKPMELIGQLIRLSAHLSQEMAATFARHGLNAASFDVLATLLRAGPPHALSPNQLLATMMVTSGTMTNRIDQLEKEGFVARIQNLKDKRSVLVKLTEKGYLIIDTAVTDHVETQTSLISAIDERQRDHLNALLKSYLSNISSMKTTDKK